MGAVSAQPTPSVVADPPTTIATGRPVPAWIGFGVVLVSAALFGMLGPLSRFAYDAGMEPAAFVAWRALIGLAAVGAYVAWRVHRAGIRLVRPGELSRRVKATLFVAALMGFTLNLAMFIAFDRITVALALLAFYTYPAMVAVVNVLLGRELLDRSKLLALSLALLGMVAVVASQLDPASGIRFDVIGIALALSAAVSQTVYVVISRDGYSEVPTEQAMTIVMLVTLIGAISLAVLTGAAGSRRLPADDAVGPAAAPVHRDLRGGDPLAWLPHRHPDDRRHPRRHPHAVRTGGGRGARRVAAPGVARAAPARRCHRDPGRGAHPPARRPDGSRGDARATAGRHPGWAMTPAGSRIRILLVDDHAMVRRGMRDFLELHDDLEIVGEAVDGASAISQAASLVPDVVVMDLMMPGIDGIEATARIKAAQPEIEIVALTSFIEEGRVVAAIEAGASGFLLKDAEADALAAAIRAARAGEVHLDPAIAGIVARRMRDGAGGRGGSDGAGGNGGGPATTLTGREREVLAGVARGLSNRAIGDELGITERTARTHVSNILAKLGLASRTQAALYAVEHGLDRPA